MQEPGLTPCSGSNNTEVGSFLSIQAWMGSGMLQTCSPLSVDTSSEPISTTSNFEKYLQREGSMQGGNCYENLLVSVNPDFLIENQFLFSNRRIANSSRLDTLVLPRAPILQLRNQLFISFSQCPRLRVTIPPLGPLCTWPAACDKNPISGKRLLPSPWLFTSSWRIGFKQSQWQMWRRSPNPSPEMWEFTEFMVKLQQSYSGSQREMLTRSFCFSSLIRVPYFKNKGVKKQSLI